MQAEMVDPKAKGYKTQKWSVSDAINLPTYKPLLRGHDHYIW